MADFTKAITPTLQNEGGYSMDANDPGGETIFGIARKKNPQWEGWPLVDNLKKDKQNFSKNALSDSAVQSKMKSFYKSLYWDVHCLDEMNSQEIANEIFDTSVNVGSGKAASFLNLALNILNRQQKDYSDVAADGRIDKLEIALVNSHKRPQNILKTLNGLQFMHYYNISIANPKFEEYFNGWLNRVSI